MKYILERKAIGLTIRRLREQSGLSQDDLAYSIGLSRRHYGSIERGQTNITLAIFFKICDGLKVEATNVVSEIEDNITKLKAK